MSNTIVLNLLRHLLNETRGTGVLASRTEKELRAAIADLEREEREKEQRGYHTSSTATFVRIDAEEG